MTAQCALYIGALKNFGTPWLRHGHFAQNLSWAFVPIDRVNTRTKFELRSFTPTWDNRWLQFRLGVATARAFGVKLKCGRRRKRVLSFDRYIFRTKLPTALKALGIEIYTASRGFFGTARLL